MTNPFASAHGYFTHTERAMLINAMEHARSVKRGEAMMQGQDPDAYEQANAQVERITRLLAKLKAMH